jgi:hypothetical protein
MRLVGTSEWIVIGVLILYVAFTPGFPVVRQFLSTGVGKAVGLAAIVAVWKYVSHPVALLLLVNYVRCSGMREFMENPSGAPANTHCKEGETFENGQCKNNITGQFTPATICVPPQVWDATAQACMGSSAAPTTAGTPTTPPPAMPTPPATTTSMEGMANMTPHPYAGVQPSMKDDKYAPA